MPLQPTHNSQDPRNQLRPGSDLVRLISDDELSEDQHVMGVVQDSIECVHHRRCMGGSAT